MLCFFPSLRDLEHCRGLISGANKNAKVIHARKSVPGGGKSDWYGCIMSSGDVTAEIKYHFNSVDNQELRKVCEQGQEWGVCFDSLSRTDTGVVAEGCSFLLDSVSWPPLESSTAVGQKSAGWEICEVRALSDILESLDLGRSETSDEWEVLNHSTSEEGVTSAAAASASDNSATAKDVPPAPTRGTVRNYRDALLKSPARTAPSAGDADHARKKAATASTWRPTILVQNVKYEHKDKLYQHNLVEQGIDPNALYNVETEEDDGGYDGGSYFQSSEFAKGSVSVSRLRAATMLRPAALEKKMSRIAAREALRPPVPGGGATGGESIIRSAIAERNRHFSAAAAAGGHEDYSD